MEFPFSDIEKKVKEFWKQKEVYKADNNSSKPKYYVLDMFPYPSGAGLHVGHPLGYIASDIIARYKRLKGFNVLHPMGFDSFGLPAEQYAIQTGQHPAITSEENIATFKKQLDKIGFSFDWSREIKTHDPKFYKWTQWIFIQLFHSWYNRKTDKAESIQTLIDEFEKNGNKNVEAVTDQQTVFSAKDWKKFSAKQRSDVLLNYRIAYIADSWVNWCAALGTVLANDEVKDGVSERGGYPVERKLMKQWSMRITAYADRLLEGLNRVDYSEAMKETQRNWIGRSEGCTVRFEIAGFGVRGNTPLLRRGAGGEEEFKKGAYLTGNQEIGSLLRDQARANRKNNTEAENLLWQNLRGRKLNYKFRRQHPIDNYIVDFISLEKKVIIELDGEVHKTNKQYDEDRTKILTGLGFKIIRFWNDEVIKNVSKVLAIIRKELESQPDFLIPGPSPKEKGEDPPPELSIEVFTTRPDTIFGATFITLAPEHELIEKITTPEYKQAVDDYVKYAKNRSERERMADVKKITGQLTGAYAINPFTDEKMPIWIAEYVLAGYGTGAVMAVPAHDGRDYAFAKHFNLPIIKVVEDAGEIPYEGDGININSDFLNGLKTEDAKKKIIDEIENRNLGRRKVNYKLRDAVFGRQRYWGEPIPIYYDEESIPQTVEEKDLPVILPEVDKYLPTETGEPPLARATNWKYKNKYDFELTTMPGWAGSCWYYLRYEDPHNQKEFASHDAIDYWENIDIYIGGDEHGTGHLIYFRFWTKFLYDRGWIPFDEPAKKLVNQGKIQGISAYVYRIGYFLFTSHDPPSNELSNRRTLHKILLSSDLVETFNEIETRYLNNRVTNDERKLLDELKTEILNDLSKFSNGNKIQIDFSNPTRIPIKSYLAENHLVNQTEFAKEYFGDAVIKRIITNKRGEFVCERAVEKMSKSKYNVINPDEVVEKYGADAFRMYEMFIGPLEASKPWDTNGIEGVSRFIKKLWRLFYNEKGSFAVNDEEPAEAELKILHHTIKKVQDDIEKLSFNTSVSSFMICVNELTELKCTKRKILGPLLSVVSPYAPFVTEYLWLKLGYTSSINQANFPELEEKYLIENSFEYPVAVNGKMRHKINLPLDLTQQEVEEKVLSLAELKKYFDGKSPKKIIFVKGRMINVVV